VDEMTTRLNQEATAALRLLVGRPDAAFRDGQLEAVTALAEDRARVLVVQRTGWGKSAVYFVATALRRAAGAGPTLIVSPLLALMRDQVAAAGRAGIRAVTMNSANAQDWDDVRARLALDEVDVLLVSPERLNNPSFRTDQLPDLARRAGLLVIDEAHCISDWGHDFRPDYRRIKDLLVALPATVPVLATTATANARVVADIVEQLSVGPGWPDSTAVRPVVTIRGGLARASLRLGVLPMMAPEQRLGWLLAHLDDLPGSGIIYTLTVAAAQDVAGALAEAGHPVAAYTGRTDPADRERLEKALRDNEIKALVATSALGMGFDKPDLGFVVHLGAPSTPVAYYQQVGRAGRATERADVLLMPGPEDPDIWTYFASVSMPRQDQADAVLAALSATARPLSTAAIETAVDIRRTRLELLLKVLDVDGAVSRVTGGWVTTGVPWVYDAPRYARVAQARRDEQRLMLDYEAGHVCRMAFLQRSLDDPTAADCGRCDVCAGAWFAGQVDARAIGAARAHLAKAGVAVEPRVMWPTGMDRLGVPVKGRLTPAEQSAPGRALGRLSDLGWGQRLRELLREDGPAPEDLLRACVRVLAEWPWEHRPVGVVAMPSRSHPQLVASLARGLAQIGRLPMLGSLDLRHGGPTGAPGGNSAFRLATVWERFGVGAELAAAVSAAQGPVLLVDDLVDSRWTLTIAARQLRLAGAPAVLPFGLALQG
jgi:ATP-dependent DNA helicase RecQ